MPADRLHLVRHGEVHNPQRILYGRLPGYSLSVAGRRMAQAAAAYLHDQDRALGSLVSSPLLRARESAQPFTVLFGAEPVIDERVIEPTNAFEGKRMRRALADPRNWKYLRDPATPSWGEPYRHIAARMTEAMASVWDRTTGGDAVIVSHQAPIWVTHLSIAGLALQHDPRQRRCALSSVTSFERTPNGWSEIGYHEPATTTNAVDVGAV